MIYNLKFSKEIMSQNNDKIVLNELVSKLLKWSMSNDFDSRDYQLMVK